MDSAKKKLKSSDGVVIEVDAKLLDKSKLLKGLVEDFPGPDDEVPLNEVDEKNLKLILEYLEHYKDSEPKEIPKPYPEEVDEAFFKSILNDDWAFNFLQKLKLDECVNLVNAANYLQIDGLINLLAAKLAYELSNCSVEEAKKKFQIDDDMTEEEKAEYDKYPLD